MRDARNVFPKMCKNKCVHENTVQRHFSPWFQPFIKVVIMENEGGGSFRAFSLVVLNCVRAVFSLKLDLPVILPLKTPILRFLPFKDSRADPTFKNSLLYANILFSTHFPYTFLECLCFKYSFHSVH